MKPSVVLIIFLIPTLALAKKEIYDRSQNDVLKDHNNNNGQSENDVSQEDHGGLTNCDTSLSDFHVEWTPKELKYNEMVTVSGSFTPNMDCSELKVCVNVTVDGIEGPLVDTCSDGGCDTLRQYLPQFAKLCPLKKGVKVTVDKYSSLFKPDIQITPGTYHVLAKLYDAPTKRPVACVRGDVTIADDYDYYDYD